jgi:capsular exopolysaccharide synthesis family protein
MPLEGKSTISANLAVVLAQAGHRVLLVDSDLRRPSQHEMFDLPNKRGLTSLLLDFDPDKGEEDVRYLIQDIAQVTRVGGLKVLTSGPVPPNPSELLGSAKMKTAVEVLLDHFDYLVFDSPPVLSVTDAVVMSTQVDATLMVVRANKSRRSQVQHTAEKLREVHANLIGVIINSLPPKEAGIGSYYYYADDVYAYDEEPVEKSKKPSGKLRKRFLRGGKEAVSKS